MIQRVCVSSQHASLACLARLFVADEGGVISLTNTETGDCLVYGSLADAFGGGGTITATAAHFGSVAVSKGMMGCAQCELARAFTMHVCV